MTKVLEVKCPHCSSKFNYYESEFRPFCCERCKQVDLGHWLDGSYTLQSEEPLSDSDIDVVIKEQESKYDED